MHFKIASYIILTHCGPGRGNAVSKVFGGTLSLNQSFYCWSCAWAIFSAVVVDSTSSSSWNF